MVDVLTRPPDLAAVLEAQSREQLAKWTINALSSVEYITRQLQLLPTLNGSERV